MSENIEEVRERWWRQMLDATRAELAEWRSMADGAYGLNRDVRRAWMRWRRWRVRTMGRRARGKR